MPFGYLAPPRLPQQRRSIWCAEAVHRTNIELKVLFGVQWKAIIGTPRNVVIDGWQGAGSDWETLMVPFRR